MPPTLALTPGEPAGIGPDLCVQLAQSALPYRLVALADPQLLQERAALLKLPLQVREYSPSFTGTCEAGELEVLPIALQSSCQPGKPDPKNAAYVLQALDRAVHGCLNKEFSALVTGPVQKSTINDAGIPFSGHTEFLAEQCKVNRVVMLLSTSQLRVALATTHLPLSQVPAAITSELLIEVFTILHHDLIKKFGIAKPRILVCGLNPHAGEGGHLGREEIEIISPVIQYLNTQGMNLIGPLPADTLFTPHHLQNADAVLAMYHDQGLPVLKFQGFGEAVNVTLGLPMIRTSVDHGTALDLVGTGKANIGSLQTALNMAFEMSTNIQ